MIGYLRFSTADQGRALSPALQRSAIKRYAAAQDETVADWYQDATSGATPHAKRPGLTAALAALTPGATLIVYDLSRLARGLAVHVGIFDAVGRLGAVIVSTQGEGTGKVGGSELQRDITACFAADERRKIGRRTRDALAAKKATGYRWTKVAPYGYRWDADDRLAKKPSEQRTIDEMRELRAEGLSLRAISAELVQRRRFNRRGNPFAASAVKHLLDLDQ